MQFGLPVCIDIDQPGHTGAVTWEVTWSGGEARRAIKGMLFVFEYGVHGSNLAEHETTMVVCDASNDCSWTVSIDPGGLEPL
ncbi:MAG: hypothetical protein GWO44_09550, partial [Thermoplasmata archaeon]|nr:hypothetical protein [Thermoplasmata archaeon]NIY03516.1 hypothetical protein [Thermoplasmata archaeon]